MSVNNSSTSRATLERCKSFLGRKLSRRTTKKLPLFHKSGHKNPSEWFSLMESFSCYKTARLAASDKGATIGERGFFMDSEEPKESEKKSYAMSGNRTRVNCLEGSYAHHYTNIACCVKMRLREFVNRC